MSAEASEHARPRLSWNPFQALPDEASARLAARSGAYVAAYVTLSYLFLTGYVFWTGREFGMPASVGEMSYEDQGAAFIGNGVCLLAAGLLGWRIWARQSRWSVTLLAAWMFFEVGAKFAAAVQPGAPSPGAAYFLPILFAGYAVLSLRGAWRLGKLRGLATNVG
jgi:hypothetical protein